MVDWLSLAIPFAYLGILLGSLATFSSLYRKRKARTPPSLSTLGKRLTTPKLTRKSLLPGTLVPATPATRHLLLAPSSGRARRLILLDKWLLLRGQEDPAGPGLRPEGRAPPPRD
jgi:hypothetical protein